MNETTTNLRADRAVRAKNEQLAELAMNTARLIAGKRDGRREGKDFATSQLRNLLAVIDREQAIGPALLWMRYQETRGTGWHLARGPTEQLIDDARKPFGDSPDAALLAVRKALGFLVQALQFEQHSRQGGRS